MSEDNVELGKDLDRLYQFVEDKDFFGVLSVKDEASNRDVQAAYFTLAKRFHPDKMNRSNMSPEYLEKARVLFEFITLAFNTLSDPSKRSSLVAARADGINPFANASAMSKLKSDEARIFAHKGVKMTRMRDWAKAERFFRESIARESDNVETLTQLGWALFNNTDRPEPARMEEARKCWFEALAISPSSAQANYYISLFYKNTGDVVKQKRYLASALDAKPNFVEAKREARLLEMRTRSRTKDSILAKLFPSFIKK
jgi:tetratricopeptide (TPR) repeat protein